MGGGEDGEGGWRGEGRNIGENREGGKEGKFPRAIRAPIREGRQGVGGKTRGWGGERPTPCPPLAYKNQIHQEYSGLRKGDSSLDSF